MSIKATPKKRGRPATGKDPTITLRLSVHVLKALEMWAASQGTTRSVLIRELINAEISRQTAMIERKNIDE